MLVSKDVSQIFSIGHGFFCPKPVKCDFKSHNGNLVAHICNFISLSVTSYFIISALNISVTLYLTFAALFHEIVILYLLILTLYAIIWLDIWECGFISLQLWQLVSQSDFISCFKLYLRNSFWFFTLRHKHASINGTVKVRKQLKPDSNQTASLMT